MTQMAPLAGEGKEPENKETSLADRLASTLGQDVVARPSMPSYEPAIDRPDVEPEIDAIKKEELDQIKADRTAAQKRIATKKLLGKLIDAAGLAYGGKMGVESDIKLSDIDTSMDEYNMRQDEQSGREMLRDRIRQIRSDALRNYQDDQRERSSRFSYKIQEFRDRLDAYDTAIRNADKSRAEQLKAERDQVKLQMKQLDQNKKETEKVNKEAVSIGKAIGKAWENYREDGDKDEFMQQLEFNGIELSDEEKEAIIKEDDSIWSYLPFLGDDPKLMAGVPFFRKKARERLGREIEEAGKNAIYGRTVEDPTATEKDEAREWATKTINNPRATPQERQIASSILQQD